MSINRPNKIIIHCSATPEGKDFDVEWIKNIHIKEKGFNDIYYCKITYLVAKNLPLKFARYIL